MLFGIFFSALYPYHSWCSRIHNNCCWLTRAFACVIWLLCDHTDYNSTRSHYFITSSSLPPFDLFLLVKMVLSRTHSEIGFKLGWETISATSEMVAAARLDALLSVLRILLCQTTTPIVSQRTPRKCYLLRFMSLETMEASWGKHSFHFAMYLCTGWLIYFTRPMVMGTADLVNMRVSPYLSCRRLYMFSGSSYYHITHINGTLPKPCSIKGHVRFFAYSNSLVAMKPSPVARLIPTWYDVEEIVAFSAHNTCQPRLFCRVMF